MSRLVLALAVLSTLSSVPLAVFNGFHLLSVIVMIFAAWAVAAHDAPVYPAFYSHIDRLDGLPHE